MLALRLPTKDIELWLDRVRGWLHDLGGASDVTCSPGPGACHVDHEHDRPRTTEAAMEGPSPLTLVI
jgi:hypothetical protein